MGYSLQRRSAGVVVHTAYSGSRILIRRERPAIARSQLTLTVTDLLVHSYFLSVISLQSIGDHRIPLYHVSFVVFSDLNILMTVRKSMQYSWYCSVNSMTIVCRHMLCSEAYLGGPLRLPSPPPLAGEKIVLKFNVKFLY